MLLCKVDTKHPSSCIVVLKCQRSAEGEPIFIHPIAHVNDTSQDYNIEKHGEEMRELDMASGSRLFLLKSHWIDIIR